MSLEAELYVLDICFEHLELGIICPSDKVYGCLLRVYLAFVENFQHIVDCRRKVHRVVTVGGNQTLSFRQKDAGLLPFNVKIHDELVVVLEGGEVFQMLVYGGQNTGFRGDGAVSSFTSAPFSSGNKVQKILSRVLLSEKPSGTSVNSCVGE